MVKKKRIQIKRVNTKGKRLRRVSKYSQKKECR